MKGKGAMKLAKLLDDLKKARHCLDAAIKKLESILAANNAYAVKLDAPRNPSDTDGK